MNKKEIGRDGFTRAKCKNLSDALFISIYSFPLIINSDRCVIGVSFQEIIVITAFRLFH